MCCPPSPLRSAPLVPGLAVAFCVFGLRRGWCLTTRGRFKTSVDTVIASKAFVKQGSQRHQRRKKYMLETKDAPTQDLMAALGDVHNMLQASSMLPLAVRDT